jgi:transcriptional regulator with XRE-family HTH domain
MNEFDKSLGRAIEHLRQEHGVTQSEIAAELGVSYQQISKYLRGTNKLYAHYLPKLAALFGVTVADLYERAGRSNAKPKATPADNDAFLAARYMRRIASKTERQDIINYLMRRGYARSVA